MPDIHSEQVLDFLFGLSIFLSMPLMIVSLMAIGKHFSDLLYQRAKKLNGIRWIQSFVNLRIHGNRVFFAFAFFTTSVLGLAEVNLLLRSWLGRLLFLGVLISFLISAVLDWIDESRQLKILLRYEEANKIPEMRLNLHKLNNRLTALYGYVELEMSSSQSTTNEVTKLQEEIKLLISSVQADLHAMDPSYRAESKV